MLYKASHRNAPSNGRDCNTFNSRHIIWPYLWDIEHGWRRGPWQGRACLYAWQSDQQQGKITAGAKLDIWQANDAGFYDVQQKGIQPDMNLRGVFTSDDRGRYSFRSVYPRYYPIPYDGSVGDMLKALDRNPNRPAYLRFMVSAPGYEKLVTHIFIPDCLWLKDDAVFGVKKSPIADFKIVDNPKRATELGMPSPFREVEWNVVLSKA